MPIKNDASPDEFNSPYFIDNKKTCEEFESFILSKNGQTKGKYNAWSFIVTGKIPHPKEWYLTIKKSTYTSDNLLLSSDYQSLLITSKWTAKNFTSNCPDFKILKSSWNDFLFNPSANKIKQHQDYSIKGKNKQHHLIIEILTILDLLLALNEINQITYSQNELIIETISHNKYFHEIERLLLL